MACKTLWGVRVETAELRMYEGPRPTASVLLLTKAWQLIYKCSGPEQSRRHGFPTEDVERGIAVACGCMANAKRS